MAAYDRLFNAGSQWSVSGERCSRGGSCGNRWWRPITSGEPGSHHTARGERLPHRRCWVHSTPQSHRSRIFTATRLAASRRCPLENLITSRHIHQHIANSWHCAGASGRYFRGHWILDLRVQPDVVQYYGRKWWGEFHRALYAHGLSERVFDRARHHNVSTCHSSNDHHCCWKRTCCISYRNWQEPEGGAELVHSVSCRQWPPCGASDYAFFLGKRVDGLLVFWGNTLRIVVGYWCVVMHSKYYEPLLDISWSFLEHHKSYKLC